MARQRGFTTHLLMLVIVLALASSCGSGRSESSSPVRLVDGFTRDVVSGTPAWSVRHDGSPEFELYDVGADPLDLSAEHPDVVERLARTIDRWHRVAEAARLPADADSTEGMSPEQLERLRGLGYIR